VLHLSEESENREISCMNFSCDGNILGVWGNDTLRIFDSEDGKFIKKIRFDVEGEVAGVFLSAEGCIVLQVKIEEKADPTSIITSSKWALYELNLETEKKDIIFQHETAKNVMYGERLPAFDVDQSGRFYIYFSEDCLYIFDLQQKTGRTLWQFEEGTVPARITIVNQESMTIAVQWNDRVLLLSADGGQSVLYENSSLAEAEICAFANNKVFFVNDSGNLMQWNLDTDDLIEDVIPRIRLEIEDLKQDRTGHIMIRYSNSCILTVDMERGVLIDTFFSNENDAVLEASLYLETINRQLIVLRTPEYEQLVLYDNRTGTIQRVDVYFHEHLSFVTAMARDNTLFIGFDRKVIAIDLLTMKQTEVWRQNGGETLFDMEMEQQTVALLLQWKMICKKPVYRIFRGSAEQGFEETGTRNVEFIDAQLVNDLMVEKGNDFDYYGMDALSGQPIYTVKGILRTERRTDPKRQFMLVKSTSEFSRALYLNGTNTFITQSDTDWLVTVSDYSDIHIVNKHNGKETELQISDPGNNDSSLNIVDALICMNHKIYCTTVEDKVIQADVETGFLEKKFDFMPGIILSGCDFSGAEMSDSMKKVLVQHGAVFH
jgi:outer membrane protein assembly factor BamB